MNLFSDLIAMEKYNAWREYSMSTQVTVADSETEVPFTPSPKK